MAFSGSLRVGGGESNLAILGAFHFLPPDSVIPLME